MDKRTTHNPKAMLLAVTAALVLTGAGQAFAYAGDSLGKVKKHTLDLGSEISYIKYKEEFMKETGVMYGFKGAYTYRGNFTETLDKGFARLDSRMAFGEVDYDGQLQSGAPYEIDGIDDYIFEIRGAVGYDFDILNATTITPYFGFGYRYLNDDAAKDPAGYERESNYYYSPLGLETMTALGDGWLLGFNVEYDIFWWGVQKSHLSDAVPALSDVENDQERGFGVRGALMLVKQTEKVDYFVEPFIRYWSIEDSEEANVTISGTVIGTALEPENHSIEYGGRFGVRF